MQTEHKSIGLQFRWPVEQTGANSVVVKIPVGNGPPVINPDFADTHRLSESEILAAEEKALLSLVLLK